MRYRCFIVACAAFVSMGVPAAAFAAPAYSGNLGTATFKGSATFSDGYAPEWDRVACGKSAHLPKLPLKGFVAGLNVPQYGNFNTSSVNCGVVVTVIGPKGKITVQVVDVAVGPKHGDLNLDRVAFAMIADPGDGIVPISWSVAP